MFCSRNLSRIVYTKKVQLILGRCRSTNTIQKPISYTETINLPKTKFPPRLSATKRNEIERNLNANCFSSLYQWQREHLKLGEFVLHDGPPYANGELHMGHAINKILKDIILKNSIVNRTKVHYIPGWDCHGLPIELKALSTDTDMSPIEIRERARTFALETLNKQKLEFASWGITADFENDTSIYKTINRNYIENQLNIFYDLYDKGLIYRDLKPVFWSPSSRTALAEAELEYDANFQSPSITVRFKMHKIPDNLTKFGNNIYGLIWTTTPWTLPTNQAVCYNSEFNYSLVKLENSDELYIVASSLVSQLKNVKEIVTEFVGSKLENCSYVHPMNKEEILPFLPSSHVLASKGTGLVHSAPAHGHDDFLIAIKNNISPKCFIDEIGCYTEQAPAFLSSKFALSDGNSLVIEHLKNDIINHDVIVHSYPIDWRTKQPVIIRASDQWFINTDKIKDEAMKEVAEKVTFYPKVTAEINKKNLLSQVQKRPYWCISRQRVWGTPIPAFYNRTTGQPIVNRKIINHLISLLDEETTTDFWWSKPVEELIPISVLDELNLNIEDIEKGQDILDIWFDSGISWSHALNQPKIADLYLEGADQFTGWFQSSLLTSIALRNRTPYKAIFTHGFTVDENGQKMSKSMGNVIHPKEIIAKYGIDTLRWWVASHSTQHALIPVSTTLLQSSAENVQRLRSILKYLIGCIPPASADNSDQTTNMNFTIDKYRMLDNYFLNLLAEFEDEVSSIYKTYQFNRVTSTIINFVTNSLSGLYLHIIKDRLYCGTSEEHKELQLILKGAFLVLSKVLWPITPYLVEECWSYYSNDPFYYHNVKVPTSWINDDYNDIIGECISQKQVLHQVSRDTNTWTLDVTIACEMSTLFKLQAMHRQIMEQHSDSGLCEFLQVSSINLVPCENVLNNSQLQTKRIENALCSRCRRFAVESSDVICRRCELVLAEKKAQL